MHVWLSLPVTAILVLHGVTAAVTSVQQQATQKVSKSQTPKATARTTSPGVVWTSSTLVSTSAAATPQPTTGTTPGTTTTTTTTTTATSLPTSPPTTTPDPRINTTVCYEVVGCFDNYPPFDNANLDLPVSPSKVQTGFWLYTRENNDFGAQDELNYTDPSSITGSRFDPKKPTKVIVHGFSNTGNTSWVQRFRGELLKKGDFNVIVVDWGRGAKYGDYDQDVANTRLVGTQLKLMLEMLMGAGLHLEDVHLLGHSLGAHTSGYAGMLLGGKIGRISGFDPADPEFKGYPTIVRLDKTDAVFVDVTHTNGDGLGIMVASGHVDFYVNGGKTQPGCPKDLVGGALKSFFGNGNVVQSVGCSHGRSYDVYMESLSTSCPFTAYPCSSYGDFQNGRCLTCGKQGCTQYGYYADQYHARGNMYLNTAGKSPFCGYHYGVQVAAPSNVKETKGRLSVNLIGQWGVSGFIPITGDETLGVGAIVARVVISPVEVGDITALELRYIKHSGFWLGGAEDRYAVKQVKVISGENGATYVACETHTISHDNPVRFSVATRSSC